MHPRTPDHPGYIFLISILVTGAIVTATTISILLLGLAAERSGFAVVRSTQALEYARACTERALRRLRLNTAYAGAETFTFSQGSCTIRAIGGSGNVSRTLCTEGSSGGAIRRFEVNVNELLPFTRIEHWREVASITLCP